MRVCGLRARVRCLRACGFACVRRACVRVRCWRACGCARALAVELTTAALSATGIRKREREKVREFVGVRKRRFTKREH